MGRARGGVAGDGRRAGPARPRPAARAARGRARRRSTTRRPPRRLTTDLRAVRGRLATLADADASWSVRLEDEFASLRTRTGFAFQARMRALQRELQDEIERIDPARAWPEVSQRIQADTAAAVRAAFLEATDGAAAIQGTIAGLLADETPGPRRGRARRSRSTSATLWQGGPTFDGRARSGLAASLGLVGGASVGVEMLGMLGTLLGAAVVGPAALGVAAVFGGKEVLERAAAPAGRPAPAGAGLPRDVPRGGPVRGRRPARLAPGRRPAPDARPLRRPDPRAPADLRGDRRGARTGRRAGRRDGPGQTPGAGRRAGRDRRSPGRARRTRRCSPAEPIRIPRRRTIRAGIGGAAVCYSQALASSQVRVAGDGHRESGGPHAASIDGAKTPAIRTEAVG